MKNILERILKLIRTVDNKVRDEELQDNIYRGKVLEKQTEKQVDAITSLGFSNKISKLDQLKGIFPQNQLNFLITDGI